MSIENKEKLSFLSLFCFGIGGLPHQMIQNSIALYITPFLLETAEIRPIQISIILFSAKAWDAITDLIVGYLVGKTKYTRFGRLKPWLLVSIPFIVVSLMMLWFVPNLDTSLKTAWYLIFYCLFQTLNTCFRIPYTALTMYLSKNENERLKATSLRMFSEIIGVLLAGGIMALVIGLFNINSSQCTSDDKNYIDQAKNGYLTNAGIMSAIYIICGCATFLGTKELKDDAKEDSKFFSSLISCLKHKPYSILLLVFLLNMLTVDVLQTNIALYCKYSINADGIYQYIIIVLLISCALSLPIWNLIMKKFGKRLTYAFGISLLIPFLFALLYFTEPIWVVYILAVFAGISMSTNFLLPWSMLPDVIDEYMIKTNTRKEYIFYSLFVFFSKLSSGVALGLSSVFLDIGGYEDCENNCCSQPASVGRTLRLLFVPFPIMFSLAAVVLLYFYPINELKRTESKIGVIENVNKST